ncbi:hypothetical protein O181_051406 [Austropuccinia psidii MF-1]|uniref:Uncharacterized protein n=1 Tax=Austropuccinia psidii MF-1 TaxID=1389203 RepID=A0A9Q3HNB5_9BASI|nr:hypothetical protein [Austropuccinia psidii MF-1]
MTQKGHLGLSPAKERGWRKAKGDWLGGLEAPRRQKESPGPKSKIKAQGLVIWKLAKEANDGRIWPEAINDDWWPEMAKWP